MASRKERLSALDSSQINSLTKSTAGTGLTIRSSRARFAASCECGLFSPAQGRKSARLSSGVRCAMNGLAQTCPLCNAPLKCEGSMEDLVFLVHVMSLHKSASGSNYEKSLDLARHLLQVAKGSTSLDPRLERHVLRNPGDHARHSVEIARSRNMDSIAILNEIPGRTPASDHTYATPKKRRK